MLIVLTISCIILQGVEIQFGIIYAIIAILGIRFTIIGWLCAEKIQYTHTTTVTRNLKTLDIVCMLLEASSDQEEPYLTLWKFWRLSLFNILQKLT